VGTGAVEGGVIGGVGGLAAGGYQAVRGGRAGLSGADDAVPAAAGKPSGAPADEPTGGQPVVKSVGCHSFSPDTPVAMADGTSKPIKDVKVGDDVTATDPVTGATTSQAVLATMDHVDTDLTDVTATASDGQTSVIHTTQHHRFWDDTTHNWIEAGSLPINDRLRTLGGSTLVVTAIVNHTGSQHMLDLTVNHIHTYYVIAGNVPVLVHNVDEMCIVNQTLAPGPKARAGVGLVRGNINEPFVRDIVNEDGNLHGCSTCGSMDPGTPSGNWIPDHQPATSLVPPGTPQTAFPQCLPCARQQGGIVRQLNGGNYEFGDG
jgi:hypothetical protein